MAKRVDLPIVAQRGVGELGYAQPSSSHGMYRGLPRAGMDQAKTC